MADKRKWMRVLYPSGKKLRLVYGEYSLVGNQGADVCPVLFSDLIDGSGTATVIDPRAVLIAVESDVVTYNPRLNADMDSGLAQWMKENPRWPVFPVGVKVMPSNTLQIRDEARRRRDAAPNN